MPTSSITLVLIRLFALHWFFTGFFPIAQQVFHGISQTGIDYIYVTIPVAYLVCGILFWMLAPKISRFVTKGDDGEFNLQGITSEQLYSAVFLGLGVYFTLNSFAEVFNWIHFFAIYKSPNYGFHQEKDGVSYYELTGAALTLIAGIVFVFNARRWAAKLCRETQSK